MKWFEWIQLRTLSPQSCLLAIAAFKELREFMHEEDLVFTEVMTSTKLENDSAFMLVWSGSPPASGKSLIGTALCALLSNYGTTHRSSWKCG
jgi:hypothetical protein